MTDFENAGEIETTAGHRIKISDVAAGNGVSSSFTLQRRGPYTVAWDTVADDDQTASHYRRYRLAQLAEGEILYDVLCFVNTNFAGPDADSVALHVGLYDDYFTDINSGPLDDVKTFAAGGTTNLQTGGTLPTDWHHEAVAGRGNFKIPGVNGSADGPNEKNPMIVKRSDLSDPAEIVYLCAELDWTGTAPTAGELLLYALVFPAT